jgi:hypothetical protein
MCGVYGRRAQVNCACIKVSSYKLDRLCLNLVRWVEHILAQFASCMCMWKFDSECYVRKAAASRLGSTLPHSSCKYKDARNACVLQEGGASRVMKESQDSWETINIREVKSKLDQGVQNLDPTIIRRIQLWKLGDFGKCMGLLPKTKSVGEELQQGRERWQPSKVLAYCLI